MTQVNDKLAAKIAEAAKTGPNMNEASKGGGGEYTLPEEGIARARLVGYYEVGEHEKKFEGKVVGYKPYVELVFELSGPKHPPIKTANGDEFAQRITVREMLSLSEKAHFFKLFTQLNYAGDVTHAAQLIGRPFLVRVFHYESTIDGKTVKKASLRGKSGYQISGPKVQDPISGDFIDVPVDPPKSELKAFIWDLADMDDWKAIHIDGWYEEPKDGKPGRSKNVIQEKIMRAKNWPKHPLYAQLRAGGAAPDLPDAEQPARDEVKNEAAAANAAKGDDPLAGIA
ncbi:hypothetical protein AVU67_gp19 [Ralstonia phage RSJ2]|uniref:Uncharacterized protein n=1 Tax=Ralstonia phage RSJ2 TaxID=1481785 RepID=A0A068Q6Y4_9CAUD|nr:hypothetical protein AVU67_gp19 [Ralstonia phage RSJ2]BAP15825.1 hypothetical protein [Ralstonia phage RSJ2]